MSEDPYPFESDDDIEIRELDLDDVDALAEARITVGQLAGENESWRYGHVIVDEAQDLTPMQWRMVMRRTRGQSLTIVGDLAQRSAQSASAWDQILPPELSAARRQDLTVNYRSPAEIHALAVEVLRAYAPDVAPSRSIRSSGVHPLFSRVNDITQAVADGIDTALDEVGGQVAVIGSADVLDMTDPASMGDERVHYMTPVQAKGLEFDAVVLVEPATIWAERGGAAQLYIALTRATQRLYVVHQQDLPEPLAR